MQGFPVKVRPTERSVWFNLALDLVGAIGAGVTIALVTGLLPTIARKGGLEPLGLAALAAAPFLANMLGAFAGRYGPRSTRLLGSMRVLGAALLVLLLIEPPPAVAILLATCYWLSLSMSGPFLLRLWGAMYPARVRGRVVGAIGTSRAAASAVAVLVAGVAADRLGGGPVLALGGVAGAACAVAYLAFRVPPTDPVPGFSPRDAIRALRDRPILARVAVAQGFYGGGLIAAAPLFALVFVDRLDLTLGEVGVIGILTAGATTLSFYAWGAAADRLGAVAVMRLGSLIGLGSILGFAIAPSVVVLWPAAIAAGIAGAAIELGVSAVVSDETTMADRAAAMAGWNTLTGARGLAAPFAASVLVQGGILDVTTTLLACAAMTAIGTACYLRIGRTAPAAQPLAEAPAVAASPVLEPVLEPA